MVSSIGRRLAFLSSIAYHHHHHHHHHQSPLILQREFSTTTGTAAALTTKSKSSVSALATSSSRRTKTGGRLQMQSTLKMMTSEQEQQHQGQDGEEEIVTGYLTAKDAFALDVELMQSPGFTLEQLMELAGLSVAQAVYEVLEEKDQTIETAQLNSTTSTTSSTGENNHHKKKKVLLLCGPGNNGGDGLVAARHLALFGYDCVVVYPKRSSASKQPPPPHYANLVKSCEDFNIPILDQMMTTTEELLSAGFDAIVDAIFGFSFKGTPREPFASILQQIMTLQQRQREREREREREPLTTSSNQTINPISTIVISVDVPSGWNVDGDDDNDDDVDNNNNNNHESPETHSFSSFAPDVLISLTAPKAAVASKRFRGRHFVGGRFLPPALAEKYGIRMPPYPGTSQVMEIITAGNDSKLQKGEEGRCCSWEEQYAAYCAEKEQGTEMEDNDETVSEKKEVDRETWEAQYHQYCIDKEAELKKKDSMKTTPKDKSS